MSSFVSPTAVMKGVVGDCVLIFGRSTVGDRTFIGSYCVLGFPVRKNLIELIKKPTWKNNKARSQKNK